MATNGRMRPAIPSSPESTYRRDARSEQAHVVSELLRSAARGVLGAMAMTGVRRVTTDLGLVRKPPPERIATTAALRGRRWAGPAYGLAILAVFETAIAPGLGIAARDRTVSERLALAGDHLVYGIVLGRKRTKA